MVSSLVGDGLVTEEVPEPSVAIYRTEEGEAWVSEASDADVVAVEVRNGNGTLVGRVEHHADGHVEVYYL